MFRDVFWQHKIPIVGLMAMLCYFSVFYQRFGALELVRITMPCSVAN